MRRGSLLIISLAVNAVFAVALISFSRRHAPLVPETSSDAAVPLTNRLRPQVVVRKQFFNWSQVESPDYRIYIAHLREIGCPEETLRDIVIADVNKLYANKRLEEVPTVEQEWWRSDSDTNLISAANAKIQQLEQERRALLNDLLGPNWQIEDAERPEIALNGPILGDLPLETKQTVRDILAASRKRTEAYIESRQNDGKPPEQAELARLEQQMRGDLAKLLTPAQLEEFLLRFSSSAQDLRNQLRGFDVTPDEFRNIFRVRDPLLQQIALANSATASSAQQASLEDQLNDTIKNILGTDRYRAYQLSQDPAYQDAVSIGAQYGASSNVVQSLYRLNLAAKREQDRINNDPTLTPEQKADQLKALTDQEQTVGDQLLGINQAAATAPTTLPAQPPMPIPVQIHPYSPGETVDQIATQYGVSSASIIGANPDVNFNAIARGTPIKIPQKQ